MSRGRQAVGWSGTSVLALVLLLSAGILTLSVAVRDWTVATRHASHSASTTRWDQPADVAEPAGWEVLQDPPAPCLTPGSPACAVVSP